MSPDDFIEAINNPEARESPAVIKTDKARDEGPLEAIFGEMLTNSVGYAVAAAGLGFISQKWSWIVFLALGLFLTLGIPAYFLLRRK